MRQTTPIITTERLALRQWQPSDLQPFSDMNADPAVMEYFPALYSAQQSKALVDRLTASIEASGWGFWAAELLATQEFIGFIGINQTRADVPCAPCVDVGWRLARPFWGRGLATEGAMASLDYAFDIVGLNEVVSMTPVSNRRSERVMQKIGMFKSDKTFEYPDIPTDSNLSAHVLYTLSQTQWQAAKSGEKK